MIGDLLGAIKSAEETASRILDTAHIKASEIKQSADAEIERIKISTSDTIAKLEHVCSDKLSSSGISFSGVCSKTTRVRVRPDGKSAVPEFSPQTPLNEIQEQAVTYIIKEFKQRYAK